MRRERTDGLDRPCASAQEQRNQQLQAKPTNVIGDASNSAYSTTSGGWRGQAQYQANVGGAVSQDAHAVVQMTLEIDPQGKAIGSSSENGCKLNGLVSPGFAPAVSSINVTFSGSSYPGFNRRMSAEYPPT